MFINLTPHAVNLRASNGADIVIPSGGVARVSTTAPSLIGEEGGIPLYSAPRFGEVEGLPPPSPGVFYIVSGLVAGRCAGRADVFAPGTGPADGAVRSEGGPGLPPKGAILAVTRLNAAG